MRSDIALYIVGVLFFVLTFVSAVMHTETTRILCVASTVVLGILSISLGHYQKLKTKNTPQKREHPQRQSIQKNR